MKIIDNILQKYSTRFITGVISFGVYFLLLGLLLFYFASHTQTKPKTYVKKNENKIQVTLSAPPPKQEKKEVVENRQPKVSTKPKISKQPKKQPKKVVKEKIVKKKVVKKVVKNTRPERASDLFKNVKTTKKKETLTQKKTVKKEKSKSVKDLFPETVKPKTTKASDHVKNTLKNQKPKEAGVENEYLAKVEEILKGWPAQSEYAGEKVKVVLSIRPDGMFEYKLKTFSNNPDFNNGLKVYLKQLQKIGFGQHKSGKTYQIEVYFIAHE